MKMRVFGVTLAGAALAISTPAAGATTIDYAFGGAGSGTMALDYNGTSYSLDSLSLTLGAATFTQSNSALFENSATLYILGTNASSGSCTTTTNADSFCIFFNPSLASQTASFLQWSNVGLGFNSGSLTITQVAGAVPEPATWAMMLLGFGAMGMAFRRRSAGRMHLAA